MKRKVAFFDIDGTIFRSSLLIEITDELIQQGLFPRSAQKQFAGLHTRWLDRQGSYEDYINAVIETFMKYIKGMLYHDFARVCEHVASVHKDRTYKFTRSLIAELKSKNYYLLAVSQSPKTILDLVCLGYGFDKVYGRMYELGPQDRFTGETMDLHLIANKANIVKRAIEKENLTLVGSIAVGDTEGDIPMLELVERAIAFNPNQILYKHAKRNKWEVVVERKDVVYKL
jgi:HAD superfamily hydrolase (TIGR01490 family)